MQVGDSIGEITTTKYIRSHGKAHVQYEGSSATEFTAVEDIYPVGVSGRTKVVEAEIEVDSHPMLVYHGTTSDVVDSILDTGLRETEAVITKNIPKGVYFTTDLESAMGYGEGTVDIGDRYAVITFEIPKDYQHLVKLDPYDSSAYGTSTSYYIPKAVPPEWIIGVTAPGGIKAKKLYTRTKEIQKMYSVVLFKRNYGN